MKILSALPVRQFDCIRLQCSDPTMAEMLSVRENKNPDVVLNSIQDMRSGKISPSCLHMFGSGAKLHISGTPHHFHIYCYSYDGADGSKAVLELRMFEALREAARYIRLLKPEVNLKSYLR